MAGRCWEGLCKSLLHPEETLAVISALISSELLIRQAARKSPLVSGYNGRGPFSLSPLITSCGG